MPSPPPSQNKPAANALQNTPVIAVLRHGNLRKKNAAVLNNVPPSSQNRNFPRAYEVRSLRLSKGRCRNQPPPSPKQARHPGLSNCVILGLDPGICKSRHPVPEPVEGPRKKKKSKKSKKKRKIPLTLFIIGYIFILTATKGAVLKKMFDNQGKERRRI